MVREVTVDISDYGRLGLLVGYSDHIAVIEFGGLRDVRSAEILHVYVAGSPGHKQCSFEEGTVVRRDVGHEFGQCHMCCILICISAVMLTH